MPYQVGSACYATVIEAGGAACSQFIPVSSIDDTGAVRTVSCLQSDLQNGALELQIATTPSGGITSYSTIQQMQAFPACTQGDYIQAAEQVFGVLLATWAIAYGAWRIVRFFDWSRGAQP